MNLNENLREFEIYLNDLISDVVNYHWVRADAPNIIAHVIDAWREGGLTQNFYLGVSLWGFTDKFTPGWLHPTNTPSGHLWL
jgi:hypothetical protein